MSYILLLVFHPCLCFRGTFLANFIRSCGLMLLIGKRVGSCSQTFKYLTARCKFCLPTGMVSNGLLSPSNFRMKRRLSHGLPQGTRLEWFHHSQVSFVEHWKAFRLLSSFVCLLRNSIAIFFFPISASPLHFTIYWNGTFPPNIYLISCYNKFWRRIASFWCMLHIPWLLFRFLRQGAFPSQS